MSQLRLLFLYIASRLGRINELPRGPQVLLVPSAESVHISFSDNLNIHYQTPEINSFIIHETKLGTILPYLVLVYTEKNV